MEIWKDMVDYPELFQVSNLGRIKSIRNPSKPIIIRTQVSPNGYTVFATYIGGRKGKAICFKVHREVAKAFLPNPMNLPQVNHKDGIKTNNNIDNLEWLSNKDNTLHAKQLGLFKPPYNSKLSEENRNYIKENYIPKHPLYNSKVLAAKFGVHRTNIMRCVRSET